MPILFMCPACGRQLEAPDSAAGHSGACKFCAARLVAPIRSGETARLITPDGNAVPARAMEAFSASTSPSPDPATAYKATADPPFDPLSAMPSRSGYGVPAPEVRQVVQANIPLIAAMWVLTSLYWGSRFVAPSATRILILPNAGALFIAGSLRRSDCAIDVWNGNARWIFGITMLILSLVLNMRIGF